MTATLDIPRVNGNVSFWHHALGQEPKRASLGGDTTADVAIAGGGLTGLWTAYYLKQARPDWRIVVVEKEFVGFGASGRNGGWLSDHFSTPPAKMAASHGRDAVLGLQAAMRSSIDEVIAVCLREGIDADITKSGVLSVARGPAQNRRLAEHLEAERSWGLGDDDLVALSKDGLEQRLRLAGATSGAWFAHCARVQPAKLVRGLASVVERLGVELYESTTAISVSSGEILTNRGRITANVTLTCLEGYTAGLAGHRRTLLPLNSAMIVTQPLPDRTWEEIGWQGSELLGDNAHAYCYAQRTADGRIAIGGRGIPYRYASRTDNQGASQQGTIDQLVHLLRTYFPATAAVPIAHSWCGVLGVPRDWASFVRYDPTSGTGIAGGYVGNGLTTTNLAGRTFRDLVLGADTDLVHLPWVGHQAKRQWEPEPLRWTGSRLVYGLYRAADRRETKRNLTHDSALARIANLVSGR